MALPSEIVADNVRRWRKNRGMDQQALADRMAELMGEGKKVDRTTVVRIEAGNRRVDVDDLALLAVALNVPLPVLLLPTETNETVTLAAAPGLDSLNGWLVWEWMRGDEPLPAL